MSEMILKRFFLFFVVLMSVTSDGYSQESLTLRDVTNIKRKAEAMVGEEYLSLLNGISSTMSENSEIKETIKTFVDDSTHKIFVSPTITVTDDISSPANRSTKTSLNVAVEDYLNMINTLYEKSSFKSVFFNNVRSSNVKRASTGRIYVKVYFTSLFKNRCKTSLDSLYAVTNREAELFMTKGDDGKWHPYIAAVRFFEPGDTTADRLNDITVAKIDSTGSSGATAAPDSALAFQNKKTADSLLIVEETRKEKERVETETKAFNERLAEGDEFLAKKQFDSARLAYSDAGKIRPYDFTPRAKLDRLSKEESGIKQANDSSYAVYIEQASLNEKRRNYRDAINFYSLALGVRPEESKNYQGRIDKLRNQIKSFQSLDDKYQKKDYKGAIEEYTSRIKKDKNNTDLYLGRGKCYLAISLTESKENSYLRRVNSALEDFQKAYDLDGNNLEAVKLRGEAFWRRGKTYDGIDDYKTYLLVNRHDTAIYTDLAKLCLIGYKKKIDTAINFINAAIAAEPHSVLLYYEQGVMNEIAGNYSQSLQSFSTVVKLDSTNSLAWYHMGVASANMQATISAAKQFSSAREKGLDSFYTPAIPLYQKYIKSFSKEVATAPVYFELGNINFKNRKYDSAVYFLKLAAAKEPLNGNISFALGAASYYAGDIEGSLKDFETAFQSGNLEKTFVRSGLPLGSLSENRRYADLKEKYKY